MEKMEKRQLSDSKQQRTAELEQIERFKAKFQLSDLLYSRENDHPLTLQFKSDPSVTISPDFYSESAGIIGEVHTHYGKLRVGQRHKLAADILKMLAYETDLGRKLEKYIIVCSEEEKSYLEGHSYVAKAAKMSDIHVLLYPLNAETEEKVRQAMEEQDLRNK